MRSPRRTIIETVHGLVSDDDRYVDCAVRVRVYRRDAAGQAQAQELLPRAYGGVYDRFQARYATDRRPAKVTEIKVHGGQLPVLDSIGKKGLRRVLALGAPGGGKTMAVVVTAIILAVRQPNSMGGVLAPTRDRAEWVFHKMLGILAPAGLVVGEPSDRKLEIQLVNGTKILFRGAARRSETSGSTIAGRDWHWAVEDEQQDIADADLLEVDFRGRVNPDYQVFSSATNAARHEFQMRLQKYQTQTDRHQVVRFTGYDNAFTSLEHWDALKSTMSPEDFDRYVYCKAVPREGRVFPAFDYMGNTAPMPSMRDDITPRLTQAKFATAYDYVIGWDPGVIVSASVIMKAYAAPGVDERQWFVLDEVTTRDATTEHHARDLHSWLMRRGIQQGQCLVIGDPHENKETDRSDYLQMQAAGFVTKRSNSGQMIERKHRIAMTNALLKDANGRIRLYLAAGEAGPARAAKTAECFGQLMYAPNGEIDYRHKTYLNKAHWGEAVGYGLFPFEKFRGGFKARVPEPTQRSRFGT